MTGTVVLVCPRHRAQHICRRQPDGEGHLRLWVTGDGRYRTEGVGYWHRGQHGDYEVYVPEQQETRHAKAILTCGAPACTYRGEFDEDALLAAVDQIAEGLPDGMVYPLDADEIMRWVRGSTR